MSRRESERGRRRGPNQAMFFDQEWHPDQCGCTQCHHEEQQVLRQFENEINRLEDEVQKANVFTSNTPRHIEEWPAEGTASDGASGMPAKPADVPPAPHDPHLGPATLPGQTESREREEKRDSEDTQWTRQQEQQGRSSSEAATTQASEDDVGLSFAREMYQHYQVRHVMHEHWPPERALGECGEDELHHYSNGTIHRQPSPDDTCEEHNAKNNNNNHNNYRNCHHSPGKGRGGGGGGGGGRFTSANQERYNSLSAKKNNRKFTQGLKDTIKRRYKTLHPLDPKLWSPTLK
ncbi:hypothetical protein E2C01_060004 [Portunus trituberculatus]|uniref:Uncharacterized protein n=1 Tax=Portunus trituberculatus TaxID=210409 RepID=A0A5B7H9A8_PORTR|nr:hypothetical protein [Portunus trituberculatus]